MILRSVSTSIFKIYGVLFEFVRSAAAGAGDAAVPAYGSQNAPADASTDGD